MFSLMATVLLEMIYELNRTHAQITRGFAHPKPFFFERFSILFWGWGRVARFGEGEGHELANFRQKKKRRHVSANFCVHLCTTSACSLGRGCQSEWMERTYTLYLLQYNT